MFCQTCSVRLVVKPNRILSPTRWTHSSPVSPRTVSRKNRGLRQAAGTGKQDRHQSLIENGRATSSEKEAPNMENSDSLKSGFVTWSKIKPLSVDVQAMVKTIGSLNIDLPRLSPIYQKIMLGTAMRQKNREADDIQITKSNDTDTADEKAKRNNLLRKWGILNSSPQKVAPTQNPEFRDTITKVQAQVSKHIITREEHDFEMAMSESLKSVETYYSEDSKPKDDQYPVENKKNVEEPKNTVDMEKIAAPLESPDRPPAPARKLSSLSTIQVLGIAANIRAGLSDNVIVKQITSLLPNKTETELLKKGDKRAIARKKEHTRAMIEQRTRGLSVALKKANTNISRLIRLEELCRQLEKHPESRNEAIRENMIPFLLRIRKSRDLAIREYTLEALTLLGYALPVKERGVRILAIDGGGTKGLIVLEILRRLERLCDKEIHEMFDYICGVSTGSLLASMLGVFKVPLESANQIYRSCSEEMFTRNRISGASTLVTSHAYYDTLLWEKILRENCGERTYVESMRDKHCPKVAAVSTLMNKEVPINFLFRNYTYPQGLQSKYPGSFDAKVWEGVRASAAAPGYYEEFKHDGRIHQDGGLLTNNPAAIAIHESRLLWPNDPIQCVISLGTGKYEPANDESKHAAYCSLKDKLYSVIKSATDTEGVHTTLQDLLPPSTYYRFNPYLSEDFLLDEIDPSKWQAMLEDTKVYCRKNEFKLEKAADQLLKGKRCHQKAAEYVKLQYDSLERPAKHTKHAKI